MDWNATDTEVDSATIGVSQTMVVSYYVTDGNETVRFEVEVAVMGIDCEHGTVELMVGRRETRED